MEYGPYIICEGPDGTGKTTLAKAIMARTGASYIHCGPPDKPALEFYLQKLKSVKGPAVVDRLHVGSYCYGLAFRNTPDLTEFENWLLEGFLFAHGALLVYCTVPSEVVDKNLARGPDNADATIYEAPEKRALVRQLYEERIPQTELTHMVYNYAEMGALALENAASGAALYLNLAAKQLRDTSEIDAIGNMIDPRRILVADRPSWYDEANKRARERMTSKGRLRFLQRFNRRYGGLVLNSTAGRYMHMAIKSAGLRLNEFAMFNSVQGDGRQLINVLNEVPVKLWKNRDVVALGRNAADQLAGRIPYRVVPHPQHVRRFHYKDVLRYAVAIRDPAQPWECGTDYCQKGVW